MNWEWSSGLGGYFFFFLEKFVVNVLGLYVCFFFEKMLGALFGIGFGWVVIDIGSDILFFNV